MMPFINADPLRLATMHTPSTAIMKNSGEPKVSTSGLRMGMDRVSTTAPKMPPMADTVNAAPKARPASPRLAMAWPSMMVAWEPTVPGTAKSTDGMVSEVVVTASMPMMKAKAEMGSMSKVKGSRSARPVTPPTPGITPSMRPRKVPARSMMRCAGTRI